MKKITSLALLICVNNGLNTHPPRLESFSIDASIRYFQKQSVDPLPAE